MLSILVLCFTALVTVYVTHCYLKWRNPKCNGVLPPGSMGFPIIGESLQLFTPGYSLDLHPFIKKRFQRYGPVFRTSVAGLKVMISSDPEVNNFIILQEGKSVEMWYMSTYSKMFSLDGESRINAAGVIHKYFRGMTLEHFGSESIKQKLLPQLEQTIQSALSSWSKEPSTEVKHAIAEMVLNFTAKQVFSYEPNKSSVKLSDKFSNLSACLMSLPLNVPGTTYYKALKDHKEIRKMLNGAVKERLSLRAGVQGNVDFLDHAINEIDSEQFLTEEFIVNLMFALLNASYDSVSMTLALVFKFLSEHPAALKELTVEHEKIVRNRITEDSAVTWEEYKQMTFTRQVINETLRMAHISPGLLRRILKDVQVKGYTIPAGWAIVLVTAAQHLNPETFNDPLTFNPWRWKELDSSVVSKNFTPFGGGTRQCAGAEYSRAFMSIFLHVLVTKYRWEKIRGGNVVRNPLLTFEDGVHVKFSKMNG